MSSSATSSNERRVRVTLAWRNLRSTFEGTATHAHDPLLGPIVRIDIDAGEEAGGSPPVLCVRRALFLERAQVDHESGCDFVLDLT